MRSNNVSQHISPMIIDSHVHLAGIQPDNGCHASPRFTSWFSRLLMRPLLGLGRLDVDSFDEKYGEWLLRTVEESELDAAGILALDGVYDARGRLDLDRTDLLVSNDYLFDFCRRSDRLLPVASINPQRRDALDELARVSELGAVALKALPNSQGFDPGREVYRPFWRRMAELELPLLTHTSFEHALAVIDHRFGHPERLRLALDEGVTVIAAHCATGGILHAAEHLPIWVRMLSEHAKLYGDLASLANWVRYPYPRRVLSHPLASQRVLLGSDFPIPITPLVFARQIGWRRARELQKIENPLQRNLETLRALGMDEDTEHRACEILRIGERVLATPQEPVHGSSWRI
jgi:uncharacterized protein